MGLEQFCTALLPVLFMIAILYLFVIIPIQQALNKPERLIAKRNIPQLRKKLIKSLTTPGGSNDATKIITGLEEIALRDPLPENRRAAAFALAEGIIFDSLHTEHVFLALLQSSEAGTDAEIAQEFLSKPGSFFRFGQDGKLNPTDQQFNSLACQLCQKFLPIAPMAIQCSFIGSTILLAVKKNYEKIMQEILIQIGTVAIPALDELTQSAHYSAQLKVFIPLLFRLAVENNQADLATSALKRLDNAESQDLRKAFALWAVGDIPPFIKTREHREILTRLVMKWWAVDPTMSFEAVEILSALEYSPDNYQTQVLFNLVGKHWERIIDAGEEAKPILMANATHRSRKISQLATQALSLMSVSIGRCDICDEIYDMKEAVEEIYYVPATEEQQYYGVEDKAFSRLRCPNCSTNWELRTPYDERFYRG